MSKDFVLNTDKNDKIRITVFGFENINYSPCLIIVHGFKGFKDWGFFPFAGNYFSKHGYFVITFNFSHNGIGENLTEFTELNKFAENTFSLEINELSQIINAYKNNFFGKSGFNSIGLIGYSRGGAVSILTAAQKSEIKAAAVWSSISKLDRYSERQKFEWRKKGFIEFFNSGTKQTMKMNLSFLDDIEKNKNTTLNIEKAVRKLDRPFLIAHGSQDLTSPIQEAKQLYEWSNKEQTEFYEIHAAGHTFNVKHPFEGTNEKLENLLNKTKMFFKQNLN